MINVALLSQIFPLIWNKILFNNRIIISTIVIWLAVIRPTKILSSLLFSSFLYNYGPERTEMNWNGTGMTGMTPEWTVPFCTFVYIPFHTFCSLVHIIPLCNLLSHSASLQTTTPVHCRILHTCVYK